MKIVGSPNRDENKADGEADDGSHLLSDDALPIEAHAGEGLCNAGKRWQVTANGALVIMIFPAEFITQVIFLGGDNRLIHEKEERNHNKVTPRRAEQHNHADHYQSIADIHRISGNAVNSAANETAGINLAVFSAAMNVLKADGDDANALAE